MRKRTNLLQARLQKRLEDLEKERQISPLPPVIIGGALVVPKGLLERYRGERKGEPGLFAWETERISHCAMQRVMDFERERGGIPRDVSGENCGYDIESAIPGDGRLLFIEVKGRAKGADTVTITKNEILTGLNRPDEYILAIVMVDGAEVHDPVYIKHPFEKEPDFGVTSVNYDIGILIAKAEASV